MYNSLNGFLIDNKEKLDYDLCHEAGLDTYFLGLVDHSNIYQPKRVAVNGVKFETNSRAFIDFTDTICHFPQEFNYAIYRLANFKIDYQVEIGETLDIRINLRQYIINLLDFGSPHEIKLIIDTFIVWRDTLTKFAKKLPDSKNLLAIPKATVKAPKKNATEKALISSNSDLPVANENISKSPVIIGTDLGNPDSDWKNVQELLNKQTDQKEQTTKSDNSLSAAEIDDIDEFDPLIDDEDDLPKPSKDMTNYVRDILDGIYDTLDGNQKNSDRLKAVAHKNKQKQKKLQKTRRKR